MSNRTRGSLLALLVLLPALLFAACGGGGDDPPPPPTYTVGGTVSGVSGPGLVLQLNGANDLAVDADGAFTFPTALSDGEIFTVTVAGVPPGDACAVQSGTGQIASANVTYVSVICAVDEYCVGGNVSGMPAGGGLVLQLNGANDLVIDADGSYTFPVKLPNGAPYAVTVLTEPTDTVCLVSGGGGTIADTNVIDANVSCTEMFSIGGSVTGATATGLVLSLNGAETLPLDSDGPFAFATKLPAGAAYSVTPVSSPTGQGCDVTSASGTVLGRDVTSVTVVCSAQVTGLAGTTDMRPSSYNRIDSATGMATKVASSIPYAAVRGLAYDPAADLLFGSDVDTDTLLTIDPLFGTAAEVGATGSLGISDINGLAYDATNGRLFGISSPVGSMTAQLVLIDTTTGVASNVGLGFPVGGTTCQGLGYVGSSDTLYASTEDSRLFAIDPDTGATTGMATLAETTPVLGLAYDPDGEQMYGLVNEQRIVRLDPTTGQGNLVGIVTAYFGIEGLAWSTNQAALFGTNLSGSAVTFLLNIDPGDASGQTVGSTGLFLAGLANDPATGDMFGITPASVFVRMNPDTGSTRYQAQVDTPNTFSTRSLVFNPGTGTLFTYAIDPASSANDILIEIDRDGAMVQNHGPSPTMGGNFEALAVDSSGPTMYGIVDRGSASPCVLYQVNPDGSVMLLHTLSAFDELRALAFDQSSAGGTPTFFATDTENDRLVSIELVSGTTTDIGDAPSTRGMVWIAP